MNVSPADRALVETYFKAMQAGPAGEEELMSIFADDAVYVEPFSKNGQPTAHAGKQAIHAFFKESWRQSPGQMTLTLHRVVLADDKLRSDWTCTAPFFPGPMTGHDLYTIRGGKVVRLEITLAPLPQEIER